MSALVVAAIAATLSGTVSHPKGDAELIVYVVQVPGTFAPPAEHPLMDQHHMMFNPHVLPIVLGTTVEFRNSDNLGHNIFSPDQEGYNLGSWPKGERRSYTFKHLGLYTQLCSIHPEMEAFIYVLQNPFFAVTDGDGRFRIDGLPPGHYQLGVWGEHLSAGQRKQTFAIDVPAAGTTTTITF